SFPLFLALAFWCAILLWVWGDFTPYVGEPDRDVWVTRPTALHQLVQAVCVGVVFAASCTVIFVLSGKLLSRWNLLRLFLVTTAGFTVVVYFYGDFKTVFGSGPTYMVKYELPWGPERQLISAACGLVLAGITAAGAWVCRAWQRRCS